MKTRRSKSTFAYVIAFSILHNVIEWGKKLPLILCIFDNFDIQCINDSCKLICSLDKLKALIHAGSIRPRT